MTAKEACELVNVLKKENETNTLEEKEFNNEWLRLIYEAWGNAIDKAYYREVLGNNKIKDHKATNDKSTSL
jgi:hypothetical protein